MKDSLALPRSQVLRALPFLLLLPVSISFAGEYAPYVYGRWHQVDPGTGANVEYLAVHPEDPNTVVCSSDACGMMATCDGGKTWAFANRGLVGAGFQVDSEIVYANGRPNSCLAWDPIDPNFILAVAKGHLVRGKLTKGSPPRVEWEAFGET